MKKIVIIRGKITAGKSTISSELAKVLPGWVYIDIWKIKEMFEPLKLRDRKPSNEIAKKAIYQIIKGTMKMGNNIVLQESRKSSLKKALRKNLKEKGYNIYSFYLDVDYKTALKRNIKREKPTLKIKYLKFEKNYVKKDKEDIKIDTSGKSISKVINIILKEINEKRGKKINIRKTI